MKKNNIKKISWIISFLFLFMPLFSGCGIFNPPAKDKNGYYIKHLTCCGPTAIEAAINEYYRKQGIVFAKNPAPKEEVSKHIQDDGQLFKSFLALFDREAVCVTWSWEMKRVVEKYGFKLVSAQDFEKLNPKKDIALVLVRGRFFSSEWHWMCYPVDKNIKSFFGKDTKIDTLYLLIKK